MEVFAKSLFLAVTILSCFGQEDMYCSTSDPDSWGKLYYNPENATTFWECTPSGLILRACPEGLVFPIGGDRCDWPVVTPMPTTTTPKPTETTTTEQPTETPTTEQPTENPTTEQPTETPTTEQPTENPTTEQPTENPTTEQPTENPTTEQPTENPTTEQPTENPTTEQPTENPTTEQPTETTTPSTTTPTTTSPPIPRGLKLRSYGTTKVLTMYNVTNYTPIHLSDESPGCTDLSQVWRMDYIGSSDTYFFRSALGVGNDRWTYEMHGNPSLSYRYSKKPSGSSWVNADWSVRIVIGNTKYATIRNRYYSRNIGNTGSTDLNSLHLVSPNTTDTAQWFEIVNC